MVIRGISPSRFPLHSLAVLVACLDKSREWQWQEQRGFLDPVTCLAGSLRLSRVHLLLHISIGKWSLRYRREGSYFSWLLIVSETPNSFLLPWGLAGWAHLVLSERLRLDPGMEWMELEGIPQSKLTSVRSQKTMELGGLPILKKGENKILCCGPLSLSWHFQPVHLSDLSWQIPLLVP